MRARPPCWGGCESPREQLPDGTVPCALLACLLEGQQLRDQTLCLQPKHWPRSWDTWRGLGSLCGKGSWALALPDPQTSGWKCHGDLHGPHVCRASAPPRPRCATDDLPPVPVWMGLPPSTVARTPTHTSHGCGPWGHLCLQAVPSALRGPRPWPARVLATDPRGSTQTQAGTRHMRRNRHTQTQAVIHNPH